MEQHIARNTDHGAYCVLNVICTYIHMCKPLHNRDIWSGTYTKPVSSTEFFDEDTNEITEIGKVSIYYIVF